MRAFSIPSIGASFPFSTLRPWNDQAAALPPLYAPTRQTRRLLAYSRLHDAEAGCTIHRKLAYRHRRHNPHVRIGQRDTYTRRTGAVPERTWNVRCNVANFPLRCHAWKFGAGGQASEQHKENARSAATQAARTRRRQAASRARVRSPLPTRHDVSVLRLHVANSATQLARP